MSRLEDILDGELSLLVRAGEIPAYEREYRFAAVLVGPGKGVRKRLADSGLRDWRFDFAFVEQKVAIEVNGGTWVSGRHNRASSIADDYRKLNAAASLGWRVLQFTTDQVSDGEGEAVSTVLKTIDRYNMP